MSIDPLHNAAMNRAAVDFECLYLDDYSCDSTFPVLSQFRNAIKQLVRELAYEKLKREALEYKLRTLERTIESITRPID